MNRLLARRAFLALSLLVSCTVALDVTATTVGAAPPAADEYWLNVVVGTGQPELGAFTAAARQMNVGDPFGVEFGPDGALYICEVRNHRILRWDPRTKTVTTVAGTGVRGYSGDGGPAPRATMNEPYEIRFDSHGNMYVVEMQNHIVRRIAAADGAITTIAGTGQGGFAGDEGPATRAQLQRPHSIALHGDHTLYIADIGNHRIRAVDLNSGQITTVAGDGSRYLPVDGQSVRERPLIGPRALHVTADTLWIALREGHSVWRCDLPTMTIHHVAGAGQPGPAVASVSTAQATFNGPKGIVADGKRYVYVVDTENQAIRRIDTVQHRVETIAGNGRQGPRGDNGPARAAELARPHGICLGPDGQIYIGDTLNHKVRRIGPVLP